VRRLGQLGDELDGAPDRSRPGVEGREDAVARALDQPPAEAVDHRVRDAIVAIEQWPEALFLERTTGFEPATPTLAIVWRMSHTSPSGLTSVPELRVLGALSHASQQIAEVDPSRWCFPWSRCRAAAHFDWGVPP
jgi:hypothetical protein